MRRVESFCRPVSFRRCGVLAGFEGVAAQESAKQMGMVLPRSERWLPKRYTEHTLERGRKSVVFEGWPPVSRDSGHYGLDNRLIEPDGRDESTVGPIQCFQRLGGMLRFYRRAAA
jgi:hypothetical protein